MSRNRTFGQGTAALRRVTLLALAWLVGAAPAFAGTFGVPTVMNADGTIGAGAANPPGFFILTTTNTATTSGDSVHQMKFSIEVTGTTLDIKVFDPGGNATTATPARDIGGTLNTTYQLFSPAAASINTLSFGNDTATTDNRLARYSCNGGGAGTASFTTANTGTVFGTGAGACAPLAPGLYELRVTVTTTTADRYNAFGLDIRDGSGNHYNVFTYGSSDTTTTGAPAAGETALIAGAMNAGGAPLANITQPMVFYPYVNRGCSVETTNFDTDTGAGNPGAGSSASITDAAGISTTLTLSGNAAHSENTITIEPTGVVSLDALNYGMYPISNNTGTQDNRAIDWRLSDWQGATDLGAGLPRNPTSAIRTYLPNGYGTAPVEPVLLTTARLVSGPNPPQVGSATTFAITTTFYNPGPGAITDAAINTAYPNGLGAASSLECSVNGTVETSPTCVTATLAGSGGFNRVTLTRAGSLAAGSSLTLNYRVIWTPAAGGLQNLTAAPSVTATQTVSATYTPASSSASFARTDTLGPVCQMAVVAYQPQADLALTASDAPDPVTPGNDITYTLPVTNNGPNAAPNTTVTDTLPAGTTFVAVSAPGGWSCTTPAVGAAGTVSCSVPSLASLASATISLAVQVPASTAAGTVITDSATTFHDGLDTTLANNTATTSTTVAAASANLSVTKTDSPDPVQAGQNITYSVVVTNAGPSNAASVQLTDVIAAPVTFQALQSPSGWSCTTPGVGATGTITCTRLSLVSGASASFSILVQVAGGTAAGTAMNNSASVSSATADPVAGNNIATATTTVATAPGAAPVCATPGKDGAGGTLGGVIDTYYPGTANAAAGATTITVGTSTGAGAAIAVGDLLLVIQMQDAAINSNNTGAYGSGVVGDPGSGSTALNNAGLYEFVRAASAIPATGGTVTLFGNGAGNGLLNSYTNAAATGAQGQRRFQVVRVPQYSSATLGSTLTAAAWNGATGGILVFDVAGTLNLGGAQVSVSGLGFRGGGARQVTGGAGGTGTDYRSAATNNFHASKGEGVAGTPRYVYSAASAVVTDTGVEGYPNGSMGRGAPANAGGGGTDSNPAANDENSGGGGGANGGDGGRGGNTWRGNDPVGGFGGVAFAAATGRIALGGGGGAGTRNNSSGVQSSGGAGGGMVIVRAGVLSGTGTIQADGDPGVQPLNDGGGGGGAGGTVVFVTLSGNLGGLSVSVNGGNGSDAWPLQAPGAFPGERHGPGGGGGGGVLLLSSAPAASSVSGGVNGITTTANDAFNALPGADGTILTPGALPGLDSSASCGADLSIVKTDSPDPALLGQTLSYTLLVTNNGFRTATSVVATDPLPTASVSFVSAISTQGTCSFASPNVSCAIGTLATGATATVTITTTATAVSAPSNTGSVTLTEPDPDATNNTSTVSSTISAAADMAVTITDAPDPVTAGGVITYSVGVSNNGPSTAANPTLILVTPPGTTFESITTPAGWSCVTPAVGTAGTITCTATAATLASGGAAAFSVGLRVDLDSPPGSVVTARASVSSTTADAVSANNQAFTTTGVDAALLLLTRATIAGLRVDRAGLLEFATGMQHGTISFALFGSNDREAADLVPLNAEPIRTQTPNSIAPLLYSARTVPIESRFIFIEETDVKGRKNLMGPFAVEGQRLREAYEALVNDAGGAATGLTSQGEDRARQLRRQTAARLRHAGSSNADGIRQPNRSSAALREGIRIETRGGGRASVPRSQLIAEGLPAHVSLYQIRLTNLGRAVPFEVVAPGSAGEALAFVADELSTTYTGRNVYVLSWDGGAPGLHVPLSIPEPVPQGFTRLRRASAYVSNAPLDMDPWFYDVLSSGLPWPDPSWLAWAPEWNRFDVSALRVAPSSSVPFRIGLWGWNDVRHHVDAFINGVPVGSVTFDGAKGAYLEGNLGADVLARAGGVLTLTLSYDSSGDEYGFAYLRSLDLGATRDLSAATAQVTRVGGFDTELPRLAGVEYLIVSHADFLDQAERLAEAKRADGLRAAAVDVERAYDRWSAGVPEAQALRALLRHAAEQGRLRNVVLFGDDTFDPQDFMHDYLRDPSDPTPGSVSFIPSLYGWDGEMGRVASENAYADLDGDGAPDVAIGRLPASTPQEAQILVDKVLRQKATLRQTASRHLFVVDNQGQNQPSFLAAARTVAARFPQASIGWADIGSGYDDAGGLIARQQLEAATQAGVGFVHYFGHGGPTVWADEAVLDVPLAASLTGPASVVLTWACQSQFFQYLWSPSVNEALLTNPAGGALASFGPAGISDVSLQAALYSRFYDELRVPGTSLGEAIRRAKARTIREVPGSQPVVEGFNLLGDPALKIPARP